MKKHRLTILVILLFIVPGSYSLANDDFACGVYLCYSDGDGHSGCEPYESKFKSIIKKKGGKFRCSKTKAKRLAYLLTCKEADRNVVNDIISKYGCKR